MTGNKTPDAKNPAQKTADPKARDPKAPEPPAQDPKATEPPAQDPKATEPPAQDPKATEPPAQEAPPPSHLTVLILRDERVGKRDYKPGDTPKLTYDEAQRLIKRGGADGDQGAVRVAQAKRKKG